MKGLIAQIHIAKKQLGLDDETYRAALKSATGKESCADMSKIELMKAVHHFKQHGFKARRGKNSKKYGVTSHTPPHSKKSQGDKIRALWIEMHQQGIVHSSDERSLRAFVSRMTRGKYKAPQFCDGEAACRIIEALKDWQKRECEKRGIPLPQKNGVHVISVSEQSKCN